ISFDPSTFSFTAEVDGTNPDDQILTISNVGMGTLNWQITETCDWLTVIPDNGSSTGESDAVIVSVDITNLSAGYYDYELTISDPCAMNTPQTVTVDLEVDGPIIELSDPNFYFFAEEGGTNPDDQILTVRNVGLGTLNWSITEDCSWLTVIPTSGSSTGEADAVILSADITGLSAGYYNYKLAISDPCAMNSPQTVFVNLEVLGPIIELSDTSFDFIAEEGTINPDDQILTIRNVGAGILNWQITESCSWLDVEPHSGSSSGETNAVILSVDIEG
ncbi:unnamed protein product, partial [marine sediment metagenome]